MDLTASAVSAASKTTMSVRWLGTLTLRLIRRRVETVSCTWSCAQIAMRCAGSVSPHSGVCLITLSKPIYGVSAVLLELDDTQGGAAATGWTSDRSVHAFDMELHTMLHSVVVRQTCFAW